MFTSKFQLVIYPNNPDNSMESHLLGRLLKDINFIGDVDPDYSLRYLTGEKFLSYLCFLGCSPHIELEPLEGKPYTYVEIPHAIDTARFTSGINVKIPRCSVCRNDLSDLPEKLSTNQEMIHGLNCQYCDADINPYQLNWRRSAFFARTTLIIGNIYESEAVPDDQFLTILKLHTGFSWKYAYVRFE